MAKMSAFGTKLYRGTSGAGVLIAQIQKIGGPGLSLDTEDVTSHDSTGAWEEVVGTILRSGDISLDLVYDPANATQNNTAGGLIADMVSRTANTYTLQFPDAATTEWTFSALVTSFEPDMDHSGALTATATLKPTGSMTLV